MNKIVAIHQPNFFPWLGYFDKIIRSDVFIILDHVQYPKKGGLWSNRVMLLFNGEGRWVTAPIVRSYHGVRSFLEMEFQPNAPWREKLFKSIATNYAKAPCFKTVMPFFEPLILHPDNKLASYNMNAILAIATELGVPPSRFSRSSRLPFHGHSSEMLASLTHAVGGTTYMCGGGAEGYQDERVFRDEGIELRHQSFRHPSYAQFNASAFQPGLSIIDAVMNLGWDAVRKLLGVRF